MNDDIFLAEVAEEWLEIGLRSAATDRAAAEKGVQLAYEAAGLPAPQRILWLGSPMAAAVAVALLQLGRNLPSIPEPALTHPSPYSPQTSQTAHSTDATAPAEPTGAVGVGKSSGAAAGGAGEGRLAGDAGGDGVSGVGGRESAGGDGVSGVGGRESGGAVRLATSVAAYAEVWAALAAQGVSPGAVELGRSVRPIVRTRPWAKARAGLTAQLGVVGFARHWLATARRPWLQLVDQIATPLRGRLSAQFGVDGGELGKACQQALLDVIYGQHDAAWLGAFDQTDPAVAGLGQVARNAGWWWAFENIAVMSDRHVEVHRDNLGRLHHGDGPALSYPDGYGLHSWRGMPIPPEVAAELPHLTVGRIQTETNAEVRRVMLEHFGFERYLRESGATKVHSDDYGVLWRVAMPGDEPLVMVEVVNATAEPDGSFRTYFLRVPPQTRTARAGVAWTFGLTEREYAPEQQT